MLLPLSWKKKFRNQFLKLSSEQIFKKYAQMYPSDPIPTTTFLVFLVDNDVCQQKVVMCKNNGTFARSLEFFLQHKYLGCTGYFKWDLCKILSIKPNKQWIQRIHQIVSPISNSESTNIWNDFFFQLANWGEKPFLDRYEFCLLFHLLNLKLKKNLGTKMVATSDEFINRLWFWVPFFTSLV